MESKEQISMATALPLSLPDFQLEGREIDIPLLQAVAYGGRPSAEIQGLLDGPRGDVPGSPLRSAHELALLLADTFVPEERAQATIARLRAHQQRLGEALGRRVGIKTAALDYLENIEIAMSVKKGSNVFSYMQLAQMAFTDQLTGLANFRYFTRRFQEEIKSAERYGHPLSLIMLDIDLFKSFNDTHGHLAGNRALEHLARILKAEVRETDIVVRYGGEEFALALPHTTKAETLRLAERFRAHVASAVIPLDATEPRQITISLGLASFPRDARSADDLVTAADTALYASKKAGRNRTTAFTPSTATRLVYAPPEPEHVRCISVVSDFNGWDVKADPMTRHPDGLFTLTAALTPGRYAYKFVANEQTYIADPSCTERVFDGYGGYNSVLVVR